MHLCFRGIINPYIHYWYIWSAPFHTKQFKNYICQHSPTFVLNVIIMEYMCFQRAALSTLWAISHIAMPGACSLGALNTCNIQGTWAQLNTSTENLLKAQNNETSHLHKHRLLKIVPWAQGIAILWWVVISCEWVTTWLYSIKSS